ncbi:uncharacterized protein LOC133171838 [Saccostrea echinata]|uniref:uncharacterized protein LOC133171838 n=1 Tax=Saccostrea echinata TaxID=191078 RepID=UPI002A84114E|nr:uncharacterized protein LOC133171838 [Saccostrea echinata]
MEYKRRLTPVKTPRKTKVFRPVGSTPSKFKDVKIKSVGYACRCIEHYEYKKAFTYLYNNYAGARRAVENLVKKEIRKGVKNLLNDKEGSLLKKCNLENIKKFSWSAILSDVAKYIPILYSALIATVASPSNEKNLRSRVRNKPLAPGIGLAVSVLLHLYSPLKVKFVQGLNSIELWRCGAQRKHQMEAGTLGTCLESDTDIDISELSSEEVVQSSGTDVGTSSGSLQELPRMEDSEESVSGDDEELNTIESVSDLVPYSRGFCITWDNVGKMVKACHQSTERQNKMMLWALAYCAENRIPTTHLTNSYVNASDIPLQKFLPMEEDITEIKQRMEVIVARIIQKEMPYFNSCKVVPHIRHKFWRESSRKSKVINLGVCQENPSTTTGTIKIMEQLHEYVPRQGDELFQLICFGDGLSCERHNDAHMARSNGESMLSRLQGLQPQVQEFHKRMLLMQDLMDTFFHGSSAAVKGTLFHLKNVFGHRSVKKDVGETFNHAADFIKFVTHGYVLLATMDMCGMESIGDPPNLPEDGDDDTLLTDVARRVVQLIWHSPRVEKILGSDADEEDSYIYCLCKIGKLYSLYLGDDVPMIYCSGIHCPGNNWFHLQCLHMEDDDVPDEEFYCSDDCRKRAVYKYCNCHVDMGQYEPMVGCDNPNCRKEWYHLKCVGLKNAPGYLLFICSGKWFCSKECRIAGLKRNLKADTKEDGVFNYITALMFVGLMDLVRHDAVRENDGTAMMSHWRLDMILFHNNHHPKYVLLGHRLLAGVAGWLPERLAMDSIWNRTVNLAGGPGRNLECDMVNEFLNKEFKESLKDAGGNLTEETIHRHSQLAGGLGRVIDKAYAESVEAHLSDFIRKDHTSYTKDLELFVKLLLPEQFFRYSLGRSFKSYPDFNFSIESRHPERLKKKLCQLSKRLDKIRRCTATD